MKKEIILVLAISLAITKRVHAQHHNLLVGTYTNKGTSEGIYIYDFNSKTADTKLKSVTKNVKNPSYLAITNDEKFVYSVNEHGADSEISAFKYDPIMGTMTLLNKKSSSGADPCYITTNGNQIIVANYSGGSITSFLGNPDGTLNEKNQVIQHIGKSIDPKRQLSAHVHQVVVTPDKKYLIATDLGEDQIYIYSISPSDKKELLLKQKIKTTPGSGPRHLAFSPNGRFAFLAHEFNGKITVFSYADGNLNEIQQVQTTPKDFKGKVDGADIHVSSDGKFLYETNRGDANTINSFAIDSKGKLTFIESMSTLGKGPRNFSIDPSGKYILIAHQYTDEIVIFNRNTKNGTLSDSGKRINVGSPVCLVFGK
ncbi:MAG: lactonase family protein [Pedobacter sp.]|nr:MAG: lactonase family protein [Pedobacter sp.]